jgi:hypothetical protein
MPTAEARVDTDRPSRYLVQLCKHAAAMGRGGHRARLHPGAPTAGRGVQVEAEWTDTRGWLTFAPWGECTLTADADALILRIDARDETGLGTIQDILTKDVHRVGRRDNLTVTWLPVAGSWSAGGAGRR